MNENLLFQDKCRGSLIGGAIGDALGYPIEFVYSYEEIRAKYGEKGLTEYDTSYPWLEDYLRHYKALFSDDTQMTLYTAEGILEARKSGKPILPTICNSYLAWLGPQIGKRIRISYDSSLAKIEDLNQRRAPGNTCISSLMQIRSGKDPMNNSKGCGGIMRIAPGAIYGATHGWSLEETARLSGEIAELTHCHKMSTFASAVQAMIIQQCIIDDTVIGQEEFQAIVKTSLEVLPILYPGNDCMIGEFSKLIEKSFRLKDSLLQDWEVIENGLGGGWVAEETLAIAIFSVMRHIDNFEACMVSAVNHGGDSDSTGAVAGNIIGAILGYESIPEELVKPLQLKDLIKDIADQLVKK